MLPCLCKVSGYDKGKVISTSVFTAMRISFLMVPLVMAVLSSCSIEIGPSSLDDYSYGNARDFKRIDGNGDAVSWADYAGKFVWAEYAGPWCSTCDRQASELRGFDVDGVIHVTVMTSEMGGYGHPANKITAANWAKRYQLDPAHVIAADLTSKEVPEHQFFSPQGQILFKHSGYMSRDEISRIVAERRNVWNAWKQSH